MKKHITGLFLLASLQMFGQLAINPQVGFNFATISSLDSANATTVKAGFQAGIDARVGGKVYLQPGLFFSKIQSGFEVQDPAGSANVEYKFQRSSVKVKALLGANILSLPATKVRLNAGPTFDIIIDKTVSDGGGISLTEQAKEQIRDQLNSSAFNIDVGAGVDLLKFTAELGYSFAFTNALDEIEGRYGIFYLNVGIVFGGE